jgi:hypothetical protein
VVHYRARLDPDQHALTLLRSLERVSRACPSAEVLLSNNDLLLWNNELR